MIIDVKFLNVLSFQLWGGFGEKVYRNKCNEFRFCQMFNFDDGPLQGWFTYKL